MCDLMERQSWLILWNIQIITKCAHICMAALTSNEITSLFETKRRKKLPTSNNTQSGKQVEIWSADFI